MMSTHLAYGIRIQSEVPLPDLPISEGEADAVLRMADVDVTAPAGAATGTTYAGNQFWVLGDTICIYRDNIGKFLVRGGRDVQAQLAPGGDEHMLRMFFIGPVLAILLHQRGMFVLHASGVAADGGAIGFMGAPGWGKSTMAAVLHKRGHEMLADDVLAVDTSGAVATVWGGIPQFKLWPDAAAAVGQDAGALPRLHPDFEKLSSRVTTGFSQQQFPLRRIYALREGPERSIERMSGQEVILELIQHSYLNSLAVAGGSPKHLAHCAVLATKVPVYRLTRPKIIDDIGEVAALVEEDIACGVA